MRDIKHPIVSAPSIYTPNAYHIVICTDFPEPAYFSQNNNPILPITRKSRECEKLLLPRARSKNTPALCTFLAPVNESYNTALFLLQQRLNELKDLLIVQSQQTREREREIGRCTVYRVRERGLLSFRLRSDAFSSERRRLMWG